MNYYIIDRKTKKCIAICDSEPDKIDLNNNGYYCITDDKYYNNFIDYIDDNGKLKIVIDIQKEYNIIIDKIKEYKKQQDESPIEYNEHIYQVDGNSINKMIMQYQAMKDNESIEWLDINNKYNKLTRQDFYNILKAVNERNEILFNKIQEAKNTLRLSIKNYNEELMTKENICKFMQATYEDLINKGVE